MSLILEALKKSEANRRLGQAPDLGTPFTPARRERSPLWALAVIVLAVGAGLWWWFGRGASAPVPAKPPVAATPAHGTAPAPQRAKPIHTAPAPKSVPTVQDTAAAGFGPFPPGSPRQAALGQQEEDQRIFGAAHRHEENARSAPANGSEQIWVAAQRKHDAPARPAPPAPAPAVQTPPAPAPALAPVAPPAPPAREAKTADTRGFTPPPQPGQPHPDAVPGQPHPDAVPGQPHPDAVPGQPHPDAVPGQPHPQSAPPAAPGVPKLDVPTYYDLPFATRKALPQLSLSMHVYTADPKQRFVILDGTRMGEGDATSDNITVREIRPDGVVLEFQGQRFFYPRDGL